MTLSFYYPITAFFYYEVVVRLDNNTKTIELSCHTFLLQDQVVLKFCMQNMLRMGKCIQCDEY